jgi:hypothetical protein
MNKIRDHIYHYIKEDLTLNDFQAWFVPATWNIHRTGDLSTEEMASEILGRLAEYLNGDWSQDEFKDILRRIAQNITISLERQVITSSDSDNIMFEERKPWTSQAYIELSEAPSNKNYYQEISQTNGPLRSSFA